MRKIQTKFPSPPQDTISFMGDSLTNNYGSMGVLYHLMHPEVLVSRLRSVGSSFKARNFGIWGHRSNSMTNRFDAMAMYDYPTIGVIWSGTNDIAPSATSSLTGGSISISGSNLYIGIRAVFKTAGAGNNVSLLSIAGVVAFSGTTSNGSISIPAKIATSTETSYDLYVTNKSYSSSTAVMQAPLTDYQFYANSGAVCSGNFPAMTVTTMGTGTTAPNNIDTQAHIQAMIKALKFGAYGTTIGTGCGSVVQDQTCLPATGVLGSRFVVMNDTSSTGGVASNMASQATTITGGGNNTQTVWEWRQNASGESGWGRVANVASAPTFCKKIIVIGNHYNNFSSGGDTLSTPIQAYDSTNGLRSKQIAAVNAEETSASGYVTYVNLYTFLRNKIISGLDTQGSASWHFADSNLHLNAYGNDLVSQCVFNTILSKNWN